MPAELRGHEVTQLLAGTHDHVAGWQLKRSTTRNQNFKVSGSLVTGRLTNKSVGKCLEKSYNLIISFEELSYYEIGPKLVDTIEILYQNNIFLFAFGKNWIFENTNGNSLLANILFSELGNASHLNIRSSHVLISYRELKTFRDILTRFRQPIVWNNRNMEYIENLLVTQNIEMSDLHEINDQRVDTIMTCTIDSNLIRLCNEFQINLVWINFDEIINEMARDFVYYIKKEIRMNIEYCSIQHIQRKDGLDGI